MNQEWLYKEAPSEEIIDQLCASLGFNSFESKLLALNGIDNYEKARKFFKPKREDIHSPFLMKDMQKAVERINLAIEKQEKILIYGDYDVDGTTAVSLMYRYLKKIIDKKYLDFYVPDRNTEGYGISIKGIDFAKENNFSLIIALDCGINAVDKIEYAKQLNIDFIICDHHLPGEKIPDAVAVLDPKRKDCLYPFKELSGCGVGFKLCQGLNTIYHIPEEELDELTDLLAVSIAADIVAITGENRIFAKMGLKTLRKTRNIGLRLLIPSEKMTMFDISNIVFEIAPKINAAGRIAHAKKAVELMISDNLQEAKKLHDEIVHFNELRREMDAICTEEAIEQIENTNQDKKSAIIVYSPDWNKGVIGIVASRLTEIYHLPSAVFTDGNNGEMVASLRSVSDFDLHEALGECSNLFLKFGGHKAAAGLSMEKAMFEDFKVKFHEIINQKIKKNQKQPTILIDSCISLKDINRDFFNFLRKLAPFGPMNMKPVFVLKNQTIKGKVKTMGKNEDHIKFNIGNPFTQKDIECIGFKLGTSADDFKNKNFDIAFTIEENYWKGKTSHYLNIKDVIFS